MDRKTYLREYQKLWIRRRRQEYFADKVCVACGSKERLELDHIDQATKVDHKIWSWSKVRRDEELEKCQPLCESCHKSKTKTQQQGAPDRFECGTVQKYWIMKCRCRNCKDASRNYQRARRARTKQGSAEVSMPGS